MTRLHKMAFCLSATMFIWAWAEEPKSKHPIETDMDAEIEKDSSTMGTTRAIGGAEAKWDRLMNQQYAELQKRLKPEDVAKLREAQKAWLAFRDKEFGLISSVYRKREGSMYVPMLASARMEVVKQRAQDLARWVDFVKEHP